MTDPDQGCQITLNDIINWDGQIVTCPECGAAKGHVLTGFPSSAETAFRCYAGHLWFRDIPGTFLVALRKRIRENPDATQILITPEEM